MGKIHTNASNKMMMVIYKYMDVKQVMTNIRNLFCCLSDLMSVLGVVNVKIALVNVKLAKVEVEVKPMLNHS